MYCMPQVGTYAALHFPQEDERAAIAVNSNRINGQAHPELQNPANRYFTTEHQKRMSLFPENLNFIDLNSGSQLTLDDSSGCVVKSAQNVNIQAVGDVSMSGNTVSVTAPNEISVAKKDATQSTVINLNNNVDTIGGIATFGSTKNISGISMPPDDTDKYDMHGLEEAILSSVPVPIGTKTSARSAMKSEMMK